MKSSRQAATGSRPQDAREGAMFAAPVETGGTSQQTMLGQIIVLPGGVVLVDDALPEAVKAAFRRAFGAPISGPIECKNGRP